MNKILKESHFDTKLGAMVAIGDEESLYLLQFEDKKGLESEIASLGTKIKAAITFGNTATIISIKFELESYFDGKLMQFKTPLCFSGTPFQTLVWRELMSIPYGQTRSYASQAEAIGKNTAYRATANANGANRLAIVIPCHRIINKNGNLGGYAGGIKRKEWLINHETKVLQDSSML